MSAELLNDDTLDVSELDELVNNILANELPEEMDRTKSPKVAGGGRQAIERYMEEKWLRKQIADPFFDYECH